jgi:hypothetical protein
MHKNKAGSSRTDSSPEIPHYMGALSCHTPSPLLEKERGHEEGEPNPFAQTAPPSERHTNLNKIQTHNVKIQSLRFS